MVDRRYITNPISNPDTGMANLQENNLCEGHTIKVLGFSLFTISAKITTECN